MAQKIISDEKGYTVVEILVSMMIFMVIMTIIGSVFVFSSRQMNNWRESVHTFNEIHISSEILFKDLLTATTIDYADSSLIIDANNRKQKAYKGLKDMLSRNEILIADNADSHYVSNIVVNDSISIISAGYIHGNHQKKYELVVANRQPTLWGKMDK